MYAGEAIIGIYLSTYLPICRALDPRVFSIDWYTVRSLTKFNVVILAKDFLMGFVDWFRNDGKKAIDL